MIFYLISFKMFCILFYTISHKTSKVSFRSCIFKHAALGVSLYRKSSSGPKYSSVDIPIKCMLRVLQYFMSVWFDFTKKGSIYSTANWFNFNTFSPWSCSKCVLWTSYRYQLQYSVFLQRIDSTNYLLFTYTYIRFENSQNQFET